MRVTVTVGNLLAKTLAAHERRLASAANIALTRGSDEVLAALRAQTAAAGLGRGTAQAWRRRLYGASSRAPAAVIWTRAPRIIHAFEHGAVIAAKAGRYLAIPTQFNRASGRRGAAVLVTPQAMSEAGNRSFAARSKGGALLWWLKVGVAQRVSFGREGALKVRVMRGSKIVQKIAGKPGRNMIRGGKAARLAARYGAVPMFTLVRQVTLAKRLDVAGAAARGLVQIQRYLTDELRRQ